MLIVVAASDEQWNELTGLRPAVDWQRVTDASSFYQYKNADVFFSLKDDNSQVDFKTLQKPVFIHSVAETLVDLGMPLNVYRINGWESFLKRSVWEVAGVVGDDIAKLFGGFEAAQGVEGILGFGHFRAGCLPEFSCCQGCVLLLDCVDNII